MNFSDLRDASDSAADMASTSLRRVSHMSVPDSLRDISLPDITLPHVSVPHISVPHVSMPHVSVPHVSVPDIKLPDVLDVDVAALAGSAAEFAGDVAAAVVTQSSRGISQAIEAARRNPKAAIGIVAVVVLVLALFAAKRRSPKPSYDAIS